MSLKEQDLSKVVSEAQKLNEQYNYFITIEDAKGDGVPIIAKDTICTKGVQSTCGSKILEGYIPTFDATVIARWKSKGGVVIGKNTQDEFGFGTFSTNTGFETPKNMHDSERSCGGSSGGTAGYVSASKLVDVALGQSTGGSISCPAAFCGVTGLTPTYGLVSRYGLIDYASSMDKIGPIGKSTRDCAELLSVIAGHDPSDSTSLAEKPQDYLKYLGQDVKGLKIGVPKEYFENIPEEISKSVWDAIKKLESLGATYKEISLPLTKYALTSYYIIAMTEASTNLAKLCGMRYGLHEELDARSYNAYFTSVRSAGFSEEAKRRIILGTYARMAGYRDEYYLKALKVRQLIIQEFKKAFKSVDVLAAPTMPTIAPKFSEIKKLTPLQNYQMDVLTVPANLAGLPTLSTPCGTSEKMPVGLHLIADHLHESKLIQTGDVYDSGSRRRDADPAFSYAEAGLSSASVRMQSGRGRS